MVAVALPSGIEHVVTTIAAWKIGCVVVPVDPGLHANETDHIIETISPKIYVGALSHSPACVVLAPRDLTPGTSEVNPPAPATEPRSACATGGTQGRPRVIYRKRGWMFDADGLPTEHERAMGFAPDQVHLVVTPLFHSGFGALYGALGLGHQVVLVTRFIPSFVADCLERFSVNVIRLVPSMMKLLLLPGTGITERDLSSIRAVHHGTAPCPPEVKRAWLELVGPERVFEGYSSQEQFAYIHIRGDDWLAHCGSVGRPAPGTVAIVDDSGNEVPRGQVGRIFFHAPDSTGPDYLGAGEQLPAWHDAYFSVGDHGYLDEDGYLFLKGRANDLINVGGVSVYPAEVEAVLLASPSVADACVVPRDHSVLGQVPHAVVVPAVPAEAFSWPEIDAHCRRSLSLHKVPQSGELVRALPRNEAGKLRRSAVPTTQS